MLMWKIDLTWQERTSAAVLNKHTSQPRRGNINHTDMQLKAFTKPAWDMKREEAEPECYTHALARKSKHP